MTGLQPPGVPDFRPGVAVGTVPDVFNDKIRNRLQFIHNKVVFRARRTTAWNVNSGLSSRFVPWNSAGVDEDSYSGWTNPADVGGGGNTTLNGATVVGATTIVVASATNFAINDYVRIGPAGNSQEHRKITNIAGTTFTLDYALGLAHASGGAVVEVTSDPAVYVSQAPGWYMAEGAVSLDPSVVTVAAQVLIPGLSINGTSPLGVGGNQWEGQELFQAAAAVQHYAPGLWFAYANAGEAIRLNYFLSGETTGNQAVDTTAQCRLTLVWMGV